MLKSLEYYVKEDYPPLPSAQIVFIEGGLRIQWPQKKVDQRSHGHWCQTDVASSSFIDQKKHAAHLKPFLLTSKIKEKTTWTPVLLATTAMKSLVMCSRAPRQCQQCPQGSTAGE